MTVSFAGETASVVAPEWVAAPPPRVRPLVWLLRRLPPSAAGELCAVLSVADGVVRRDRLRRAHRWAVANTTNRRDAWRLALRVIAQHGRFVAQESLVPPSAALRDSTIVRGVEHLSGLTGGALLLGAHVGPPRTWVALRAHGYPVRFAGRMEYTSDSEEWRRLVEEQIVIPMRGGDGASRVQALYAIRRLLASGALVFMTSDGPFGREAFRIELPGGSQIIRSGWLTLRRQLRVPTLPVFAHLRGRERVIEIHPPLPAIDDDEARDVEACRRALTPIIGAYVRAHPEQCRYLAFPPW